jgi:C4-dicarboxylate transporter DctM subunit
VIFLAIWYLEVRIYMDPIYAGILGVVLLMGMLLLRIQIFAAMGIAGAFGYFMITGTFVGTRSLIISTAHAVSSSYDFFIIPLFILLGAVVYESGMGLSIYECLFRWFSKLRAGIGIGTMIAVAIFSAVSGSSLASAVTFSKISAPEMVRRGYKPGLACGIVAAAATQDALIPPSGLLVMYAILTEQSIGKCLIAGFIPGFLSVFLYSMLLLILAKAKPLWFAPGVTFSIKEKLQSLRGAWQIPLLAILVLGCIYTGITTPTEAAAAGSFLAIVLGLILVGFKGLKLPQSLRATATSSTMIFGILIGAFIFGSFFSVTRIPNLIIEAVITSGISKGVVLLIIIGIYTGLGMFMSVLAMLVVTMPVFFPLITSLGYDPIWFGVIAVKMCGVGMLTPPVGLCVYAVKGTVGELATIEEIFKCSNLFLLCDYICLVLLIFFPEIALFLPNRM